MVSVGGESMTRTEVPVVRKQVVVKAPAEQAFTAFTERFGDFKPPEHNLLAAAIAETVFEPYVGGHIYQPATHRKQPRRAPGPPCARPRSPRQFSSLMSAATSTTAPSTAANAGGRGSWSTNPPPAWYSAGTSARNGRSRPTRS